MALRQKKASPLAWWEQQFEGGLGPGPVAANVSVGGHAPQQVEHLNSSLQGLALERLAGADRRDVGFVVDILLAQADTIRELERKISDAEKGASAAAAFSRRALDENMEERELVQDLVKRNAALKEKVEGLARSVGEAEAEIHERDRLGLELIRETGWLRSATDEINRRSLIREERLAALVATEEGGARARRIATEHWELKQELRYFKEDSCEELKALRRKATEARAENEALALENLTSGREEARLDELLGVRARRARAAGLREGAAAGALAVAVTDLGGGRAAEAGRLFDAFASVGTGNQRRMTSADFGDLCEMLRHRRGRGPAPLSVAQGGFVNFAFAALFGCEAANVGRTEFVGLCSDHLAEYLEELEEEFLARHRGQPTG